MPVYLLATLDTKGEEAEFVRRRLGELGVETVVVDGGCLGEPAFAGDVTREEVFRAAGVSLAEMQAGKDRGRAVAAAAEGAATIVSRAYQQGRVEGVLGLGGSAGSTLGAAAMQALPVGVPKLLISTLASGQVRQYVGEKDILMLNPVVDLAGINRISRIALSHAAAAMAGMVGHPPEPSPEDKPLVAATMFGVTTPCVEAARRVLEQAGYEVLVFHATGSGGRAMESLVAEGLIAGVLDVTTTELADELVGGILSAGPERLTAAGRRGVPQVISVGATDMVNFGPPESVPEKFRDRKFYQHNPTVTLMRTTMEENARIGAEIGRKAAAARGPTTILLPLRGVSAIDAAGQPFDDPEARAALFDALAERAGPTEIVKLDAHINDPPFAQAAAEKLVALMAVSEGETK